MQPDYALLQLTLAQSLDNSTGLSEEGVGGYGSVPSEVDTLDYGNSALDIRSRLAGSINYELPFGRIYLAHAPSRRRDGS